MRDIEEIKKCKRLIIIEESKDGFNGIIQMPLWKGSIICSWDFWDHVSVSPAKKNITPSWDDMCLLKDIFFKEDEAVIQIHPPKAEYVNQMPNCLHLWRWNEGEMTLPPSWMVGIKKGQTQEEVIREIMAYYKEHGKEL
jgi:hypothetical protein